MNRYQCQYCLYEWSTKERASVNRYDKRFIYCPDCEQQRDVIPI